MALSLIPSMLSLGGALLGKSASDRQARAAEKAAEPNALLAKQLADMRTQLFPDMLSTVKRYYAGSTQETDPLLLAQHEENLADIDATTAQSKRDADAMWAERGDPARGYGAKLRLTNQGLLARGRENTNYATISDALKNDKMSRYMNAAGSLAGMASNMGPANTAAEYNMLAADTRAGFTNSLGDTMGSLADMLAAQAYQDKYLAELRKLGIEKAA